MNTILFLLFHANANLGVMILNLGVYDSDYVPLPRLMSVTESVTSAVYLCMQHIMKSLII